MKILILNGSSCSGKSTIIKNIMKERDDIFYLHYDSLKWSFSKYDPKKHQKDVQRIVLSVAKEALSMRYKIISDFSLTREFRDKLINLSRENNYEVIEINLEADFDVLLKRFNERVESALSIPEKDRKISNLSVDRFKELYGIYNNEKNINALTFQTDVESSDEITKKINEIF